MGYYTAYKVLATIPEQDVKESAVVRDIVAFFRERNKDVDECNIAALIARHPQHFNVDKLTVGKIQKSLEKIVDTKCIKIGERTDQITWYNHEEDMVKLSLLYPEVSFQIDGEGEEAGDIWRATVKNGEFQRKTARIVFDD